MILESCSSLYTRLVTEFVIVAGGREKYENAIENTRKGVCYVNLLLIQERAARRKNFNNVKGDQMLYVEREKKRLRIIGDTFQGFSLAVYTNTRRAPNERLGE